MSRRPTIGAVAEAAGVAASTVSRALNGGYVSQELKTHIDSVIARLGYRPWSTARNFKLGRSGSVGLVVEDAGGAWFTQLLAGIESELRAQQVSLQLGSLDLDGVYDSSIVSAWVRERRVDGVIFVRARETERPLVLAAKRAGLPIALIAPDLDFGAGQIFRSRNRAAGRELVEHLLSLGHRRVGFVGGPRISFDSRERLAGLREGLKLKGLQLDAEHVTFADQYNSAAGATYAEQWLARRRARGPSALVFGNDSLALGFMRVVQSRGIVIPRDVSVVGFDDVPEAALHWPGLTTARQLMRSLGASACKAVLSPKPPASGKRVETCEFPVELVVRESTGRVASS